MNYQQPIDALKDKWGYDSFRPLQAEIIDSVLSGADTLALMPTGGGKSITFQVPGLMLGGITVVITPLISLMKDQVDNLRSHDVAAVYMHSGLTRREWNLAIQKAELGKVKFIYLSPERLQNERFFGELKTWNISLIVVDEAHCISQWGYDFRPSYLGIAKLRRYFPKVPVMAVTASATPQVADDIRTQLEFRPGSKTFQMSFARPNIHYIVRRDINKAERLLTVLRNTSGTAIVYVRSRKKTAEIAKALIAEGISAESYHAGLLPEEKDLRQQRWKDSRVRVMVATNAFGMGIDKPDVRVVIHYDLPSSLEEYYQEAGRAGRDGKQSFAVALVSPQDRAVLRRRLEEAFPPREYIAGVYEKACLFIDLCLGEGQYQTFDFNLEEFCTREKLWPATARSALQMLSLAGYVEYAEDVDAKARVMAVCRRDEMYAMQFSPAQEKVMVYLLRTCPGIFADYVNIVETVIASYLGMTTDELYHTLLDLTRMHAIHYVPRRQQPFLYFPSRRIEAKYVDIPKSLYDIRRARMEERIKAMEQLAFGADDCRAKTILSYFGEQEAAECGTCDVCRSRSKAVNDLNDPKVLKAAIRHYLSHHPQTSPRQLFAAIGYREEAALPALRALIDSGHVAIDPRTQLLTPNS
ncbi:MAG: RecQ family ATP-dependent DNA helicase [Bacteroides sp.]|nr:RecQ family ATP-dependent DNA helicase [Bacteroides sp.]MCM1379615.1 RecQ family ATP-dependent DNA helicase [Bacteroides sp.]MCM1446003.1 RecQ family ATP-dependent DNA helicase [Prevotella sp.]